MTTWQHTHKEYTPCVDLVDDPAEYAKVHGLVDDHSEEARAKIGAWRWAGLWHRRNLILPLIQGKRTIDFGGQAGSVGYGAIVVDWDSPQYRAIYDVPGLVDTIFTSHTLEHVPDLISWLGCCFHKLNRPGHLIVYVPNWHNEMLRAENWPHHCHTFCMSGEEDTPANYIKLDAMIAQGFKLLHAESMADMNTLIIGKVE